MVLSKQVTARIKEVLEKHPEGLSITDLVKSVDINRNTAGRYLENLLLSGQVEMRRFGMAKLYTLAKRLPLSSVLSISSELVLQLDFSQRVSYANDTLLAFIGAPAKDLFRKNIEYTPFATAFEDVFPELMDRFRRGLRGEEWYGELPVPVRETYFFCRVAPTVSNEGTKGVSIFLEDITDRKRGEERIRKSEARLRSIFKASPVGIGVTVNRVLLEVNDRLCQMTGYSADELVGRTARMLYASEEEFERVGTLKYNQIRESGTGSVETRWVRKDGMVIDILLSSTPLDPANISAGITFTAMDITGRKKAERELRESEEKYRHLVEQSQQGLIIVQDGRPVFANPAVRSITGYAPGEFLAFSARELIATVHPDDRSWITKVMADRLAGENIPGENEYRILRKDKTTRWILAQGVRITFNGAPADQITFIDVTGRKLAEQALRESEDRYRKLVEISPDAVILHQEGKITYVNPAAIRLLGGRDAGEILGREILGIIHPGDRDRVRINIEKDLNGERTPAIELSLLRVDGTPVVVEGRGISTAINGIPTVLVALNDITDRYQAGLALKMSEERYRSVFENTGAATAIIEENTIISFMNSEFERFSGYTKGEIEKKKSWTDFVAKEDRERMLAWHYQRREDGDAPRQYEFGFIRKNGEVRRVLITVGMIPGTTQAVASMVDITDREQTEQALLESERRYRTLAETSRDIIFLIGRDDRVEYVNSNAAAMFGIPACRIIGRKRSSLFPGEIGERQAEGLAQVFRTGKPGRSEGEMNVAGAPRWFDHHLMPVMDAGGTVLSVMGVSRDITDRKEAEQLLKKSGEQYRFIADNSLDIINRQTPECILTYVSPAVTAVLGYTEEEVLGRSMLSMVHPDDIGMVRHGLTEIARNGSEHATSTFRFRHRDGQYLWFESRIKIIRDEKTGAILEFLSISRDITGRKEAGQAHRPAG